MPTDLQSVRRIPAAVRPTPCRFLIAVFVLAGIVLPAGGHAAGARVDLDVAVPPGSPLDWGQSFPAIFPRPGGLHARTPDPLTKKPVKGETYAPPRRARVQVRLVNSFSILRILTWDLTAHLSWTSRDVSELGYPTTGRMRFEPPTPHTSEGLYWASAAPLLRLLLHPAQLSQYEVEAHLLELGEPTLEVLDSARAEKHLVALCRRLDKVIGVKRASERDPGLGRDEHATMWRRFTFHELLAEHPYDPEGSFGGRLFLFGEELQRVVASYVDNEDPFLRRNAVTALGRYPNLAANDGLVRVAVTSTDPVCVVRALSAIGRVGVAVRPRMLLQRLNELGAGDQVLRVAFIGALGRLAFEPAIPTLVAIGEKAFSKDSDLLLTVLVALLRIPLPSENDELEHLIKRVGQTLAGRRFKNRRTSAADFPDSTETRERMLEQFQALLRLHIDPNDEAARYRILALLREGRAAPMAGGRGRRAGNLSVSNFAPLLAAHAIDALGNLGEEGWDGLRKLSADFSLEAGLRGRALASMPWSERSQITAQWLRESSFDPETRVQAWAIAVADRHPDLVAMGHVLLAECVRLSSGQGSAPQRFLYLQVLRDLEKRGELSPAILISLARLASSDEFVTPELVQRVRMLVDQLVRAALASKPTRTLSQGVERLLNTMVDGGGDIAFSGQDRKSFADHLVELLVGIRGKSKKPDYVSTVKAELLKALLGEGDAPSMQGYFEPPVALEQEIVLALGRLAASREVISNSKRKRIADVLIGVSSKVNSPHRAAACLALGMHGDPAQAKHLVPRLLDKNGFVRLCAYRSLRDLTGEDFMADWMFGSRSEHIKQADLYSQLLFLQR